MARSTTPSTPDAATTNGNGHNGNGHANHAHEPNGHAAGPKTRGSRGSGAGATERTTGYHQLKLGEEKNWPGLSIERRFTREGVHPYDTVEWDLREAAITNEHGKVVFEQKNLEFPKSWSALATNVVASKYFRGTLGSPERERSRQADDRPGRGHHRGLGHQGRLLRDRCRRQAFRDELKDILLKQRAAFNSPVWFNVGIDARPQCSACFINSVQDTMESILTLAKTEGMLFKYGSGTGSNLSTLRSKTEGLRGGGIGQRPGQLHEGLRRLRGRDQVGWQDPARGQDGDPQHRPSRHRGVHRLQAGGGEQGLGADRRRL